MLKRVNMNLPEELLERLDTYAKKNYQSRSSVMCQACDQFLTTAEIKQLFAEMSACMHKITETQTIDEETKKQLDQFEMLCQMFTQNVP